MNRKTMIYVVATILIVFSFSTTRVSAAEPTYATLQPNMKFAVPVDLRNYSRSICNIGLPSLQINRTCGNSDFLGIAVDGHASGIVSGGVWLGIYRDVFPDRPTRSASVIVAPDLVYVQLIYAGVEIAVNRTIILSVDRTGTNNWDKATLLYIPLILTGESQIKVLTQPIIVSLPVIIAGAAFTGYGIQLAVLAARTSKRPK